jgi:hypothetical protein
MPEIRTAGRNQAHQGLFTIRLRLLQIDSGNTNHERSRRSVQKQKELFFPIAPGYYHASRLMPI